MYTIKWFVLPFLSWLALLWWALAAHAEEWGGFERGNLVSGWAEVTRDACAACEAHVDFAAPDNRQWVKVFVNGSRVYIATSAAPTPAVWVGARNTAPVSITLSKSGAAVWATLSYTRASDGVVRTVRRSFTFSGWMVNYGTFSAYSYLEQPHSFQHQWRSTLPWNAVRLQRGLILEGTPSQFVVRR